MLRVVAALGLSLCIGSAAHGWGADGHRISAYIASSLLTDTARQQLRSILGHNDLAKIATAMDDSREAFEAKFPGASRWHYENRLVCATSTACPQGQCVTRQIDVHLRVLEDAKSSPTTRSEAIAVLVHLIADLHQPLHLADNSDRGGNDAWVILPGESDRRRLHEAWDTRFVRLNMQRSTWTAYARKLAADQQHSLRRWQNGTVEQWASESYRLGRDHAYGALPRFACKTGRKSKNDASVLTPAYVDAARIVTAEQLAKAGARIAFVLNRALK